MAALPPLVMQVGKIANAGPVSAVSISGSHSIPVLAVSQTSTGPALTVTGSSNTNVTASFSSGATGPTCLSVNQTGDASAGGFQNTSATSATLLAYNADPTFAGFALDLVAGQVSGANFIEFGIQGTGIVGTITYDGTSMVFGSTSGVNLGGSTATSITIADANSNTLTFMSTSVTLSASGILNLGAGAATTISIVTAAGDELVLGAGAVSLTNASTALLSFSATNLVELANGQGEAIELDPVSHTISLLGGATQINTARVGFFGATPVAQQTGGALTAGLIYSSNEQTMLNEVFSAMRAYGLLT